VVGEKIVRMHSIEEEDHSKRRTLPEGRVKVKVRGNWLFLLVL
jgi:hypothetical protein